MIVLRAPLRQAVRLPAVATLLLALAGCATPTIIELEPRVKVIEREIPVPTDADRVLDHYALSRHLAGREAAQAVLDARVAFATTPSDLNRIRLATLLVLSRDNVEADAAQLIDPLLTGEVAAGRPLQSFALLLKTILDERQRWRESVTSLQGRSREGKIEAQAARSEARQLQERIQALQQQLDALTDIEKSIAHPRR